MAKYRIVLTDKVNPGAAEMKLKLPGQHLFFRRRPEPQLEHEVDIPEDLAQALQCAGYEMNPVGEPPKPKQSAKAKASQAEAGPQEEDSK